MEKRKDAGVKKATVWMAALLLALGAARAESAPAVFRVTDGEGHCLYLLGTVHVGREEMFPLGPAVESAWQAADILAVEADISALEENALLALRYAAALRYGRGDEAKRHLPPKIYRLGAEKLGVPEAALNQMRPMAWVSLAEEAAGERLGFSSGWGADAWLLKRAKKENKPVEELEGIEAQLSFIQNIPDEVCAKQLDGMLSDPEGTEETLLRMLNAWMQGDTETLAACLEEDRQDHLPDTAEAFQSYNELIYTERNRHFARQAMAYMESGKTVLMAVGAAHVLGEDGLAELLGQAGYTMEKITE